METKVSFLVNGKQFVVPPDIEGDTPLVTFLRKHIGLKGTKYMCREGTCGACIVNYTIQHPVTQEEKSFAVNSCLLPVLACHGASITTIEGIGNKVMGYNKVQATLAKFNGTQCGFCSPGMVMNMYSLLSSNDNITMKDVEHSFAGNVCRCTGYRSILDAFKSLSSDATEKLKEKTKDIEDLWKLCPNELGNCNGCAFTKCSKLKLPLKGINNKTLWLIPGSIQDIIEMFKQHESYRLVAGNTGQGVYRYITESPVYININHVQELKKHDVTPERLELGANMSLTETISLFETLSKKMKSFEYLKVFADHIYLIANVPIRNTGTLAGNLMIKYYHPEFPSDLFLLFEIVKATIMTVSETGENGPITLKDMFSMNMNKSIITKIILPAISKDYIIRTFKIMPRAQNALALVNAGFLFRFNKDFCVIEKPSIVYGCINSSSGHASKCEDYFTGNNIFEAFKTGISILSEELNPSESIIASTEFKKQLALNLFYKYVLSLKPDQLNPLYQSGGNNLLRPLSHGIQDYDIKLDRWPLMKPVIKTEALIQCSGEAEYVNDIPELQGQLFGALVLAEQVNTVIKSIDPSLALAMDGVFAFFSAKDIPGKNTFTPKTALTTEEELFCSGKVLYGGQPVGIVIAETEDLANKAARIIKIDYTESQQEQICLSVKDALKTGQTSRIKHFSTDKPCINTNLDNSNYKIEGQVEMGPQFHFTMEPQSCVCSPIEDGINIYSSTQWMSCIQGAVSEVLNIPENSINMEVKRIGGGFGSKITRASMVGTACALAAYKLNRPVKVIMDIETNMKAIGKRNASYTKYEASFDETGFIEWLKLWHYSDEGCSSSDPAILIAKPALINCYDSSGWEINLYTVSTTTPSSSWMRGPGTLEGMAAIEEIMEHISFVLKKDPLEVRMRNIGEKFNYIHKLITTLTSTSDYIQRREKVETFNKLNRWKKRGISLVPMAFDLFHFFAHSSMVSIYGFDGTVSITHAGIEMGQGINTKAIQICASVLGIHESKIKVKASSVLTSPNGHMSGASITSENVAFTTMKCCEILNKRLEPIRNEMKDAKWEEIIAAACIANINLNASYTNKPQDGEITSYTTYGSVITEVEIDVLTGQHQIIRTDILEDAGESISPEIDIGQVEGGFIMGMGYLLTEHIKFDTKTGLTLTNNTSNYWVPGPLDIPIDFRVTLLKDAPNPYGVVRSKATGEPPICLALSVVYAIRNAIMSARENCGDLEWFSFSQPFSVEKICQATKTVSEHFNF